MTKESKAIITDPEYGETVAIKQIDQRKNEPQPMVVAEDTGIVSLTSAMSSKDLRQAVKLMTDQRKIIADFVKENLVDGVDFGVIESTTKSGKTFKSKPTLYKPGMEKIFSLFGLATELEKDTTTLEMLDTIKNCIAFKCSVTRNGQKIAEGRGAATVGDMGRDVNATIKIAEKRARMDACLSMGFSEYFTQDMDDPEYRKPKQEQTQIRRESAVRPLPVSDQQRKTIFALMHKIALTEPDDMKDALVLNGYPASTKEMTRDQASKIIDSLVNGTFARPPVPEPDDPDKVITDIPDEPIDLDDITVVDDTETFLATDEIKEDIEAKIKTLGLTPMGRMRLLKETTKNRVALSRCDDDDWMKLQTRIDNVLNGKEELPTEWFEKETTPKQNNAKSTGVDDGTSDTESN